MKIYSFEESIPNNITEDFINFVQTEMEWYSKAPGGFLTNSPNRKVNTFGDGGEISSNGNQTSKGWPLTFWTAKVNQNNVSLATMTEKMPKCFSNLVPYLRILFKQTYPFAKITNNTFNIAVCNYYTEPEMNIAAHTDDNVWYPREFDDRPAFASITLYPNKKNKKFAKFQIYEDKKWKQVDLEDKTIMIMPSDIMHRVNPSNAKDFSPRINITFRSTYEMKVNPVLNAMAVANHCRYYKIPSALYVPGGISEKVNIDEILKVYNEFNKNNGGNVLKVIIVEDKSKLKKRLKKNYDTMGFTKFKAGANLTMELLAIVCQRIGCCK